MGGATGPGGHGSRGGQHRQGDPASATGAAAGSPGAGAASGAGGPLDPGVLLHDPKYVALLVAGAVLGVPVAAVSLLFLKAVALSQHYLFATLPHQTGFPTEPAWWPLPVLMVSGLVVAASIRYLPGTSGHSPADGFHPAGAIPPLELPGIVVAAFVTLAAGVVLGPEAPLIAIGSGLGVLAVRLAGSGGAPLASMVVGAAGSFAAVSTLLGSPIVGAFLLLEAAGLGGAIAGVLLLPGLLAAGIGALLFTGLGHWTGFGTLALAVPHIPHAGSPDAAEFGWAVAIGMAAAVGGAGIRRLAVAARGVVAARPLLLTPLAGALVALAAMVFAGATGRGSGEVLFSGQTALPTLIEQAGTWTAGALVVLLVCKGLAYAVALSSFRGGPIFPGMFLGAVGGMALSHLAGLPMIAGVAMGIGAMTTAMLGGLPLTSVLLVTLFLVSDGLDLMPLVIVAVVVSYTASARLAPTPAAVTAAVTAGAAPVTEGAAPAGGTADGSSGSGAEGG